MSLMFTSHWATELPDTYTRIGAFSLQGARLVVLEPSSGR